jgi:hypothetical protein
MDELLNKVGLNLDSFYNELNENEKVFYKEKDQKNPE